VYIDFNMVRAGVVKHPAEWPHSGYLAIQQPPKRYRVVDLLALSELSGFDDIKEFQKAHREWVEAGSRRHRATRRSLV
jgi:REP-associated tyrosine transposase